MSSDELVRSLVADLKPVRRLRGVEARTALWAALALVCVGAGSLALGVRPDLGRQLGEPAFVSEGGVLLVLFLSWARLAFLLSVPGAETGRVARAVPLVGLLAWGALLAGRWSAEASGLRSVAASWGGLSCVGRMLVLALAPVVPAFFLLRRALPLERARVGFSVALAASALASLGTRVVCAKDEPAHLVAWHVVPALLAALAGACTGEVLLRRGVAADRGGRPRR